MSNHILNYRINSLHIDDNHCCPWFLEDKIFKVSPWEELDEDVIKSFVLGDQAFIEFQNLVFNISSLGAI